MLIWSYLFEMARRRKVHIQQWLFRHGGRRSGAGRKPKGTRAGAGHRARPELIGTEVLHVVLRVAEGVGSLRQPVVYGALQKATRLAKVRGRFRIVHLSIQRTHVHLLVEAEDKARLAAGMQGFQISAARHINTALGKEGERRRGKVFADRYHLVVITSPRQVRHAIAYVLLNWRKHHEDRRREARGWMIDPYSSARAFPHWLELSQGGVLGPAVPTYGALEVSAPQTWLLSTGWQRAGSISVHQVPGPVART
jgi:REP element-mobilizing transposase RayT